MDTRVLFSDFKKHCLTHWDRYFSYIGNHMELLVSDGATLFPTHILFMDFGDYFAMELIGAKLRPQKLKMKIAKYDSVYDYLDPFHGNQRQASITLNPINADPRRPIGFSKLTLAQQCDLDEAANRFPYLGAYPSRLIGIDGKGSVFDFGPGFASMFVQECSILNHEDGLFRSRNVMFLGILKRTITSSELRGYFDWVFGQSSDSKHSVDVAGVFSVSPKEVPLFQASALQNLYISSGVHETTIDDFLAEHPSILEVAFGSNDIRYNSTLKWLEHDGSVQEVSIKPDLFVRRSDGYYDIVDLKLAALSKKSLTKSNRSRRRFIDYVAEGLAQLANYEFYFSFPKNHEYAKFNYGIEVKDPQKVLVVGSMENVDHQEVLEALRAHGDKYSIIDYDTLISRCLGGDTG